jgi:small-conductance mechanosensitive channel
MIGGIQIAVTQPVSIGDSVMFEGEWGYVEKIAYTYITIRTWDQRRLVVPLRYFLSHPVQNWSMKSASLIKPIHFYLDYTADISRIREKFDELVRNSDEWDETIEPTIEVTDVTEQTIEIRALCSAKNPITAWVFHCRLREEMIRFIQEWDEGGFLPRERVRLGGDEEMLEAIRKPDKAEKEKTKTESAPEEKRAE